MSRFLAVLVAAGCAPPAAQPSPEVPLPRWEQRCEVGHDLGSTNNILRQQGEQGWELVAVAGDRGAVLCFKRPLR